MTIITIALGYPMKVKLNDHLKFMGLGLCLFSMNFNLFGGLYSTSGLLAVVFSATSQVNIFLVTFLTRMQPKMMMVIVAMMRFIGVGLIYAPQLEGGGQALTTLILCLIGTLFFCSGNII